MSSRIKLVPYPDRVGVTVIGPPVSRQASASRAVESPLDCRSQLTDTEPLGVDNAPYFNAFVISSCSTIATAWVAAAVSVISGPLIFVFALDV